MVAGNTNPLAGQPAFTGSDGGSVEGSWGRSHVRLGNYANPGDTVRLRWAFGTDGCGGAFGWYVDDVTVYACAVDGLPTIDVNDTQVIEGNSGFTAGESTVSLSHASANPVSVRYRLEDGSAKRGTDWIPFDNGFTERTVVIPPLTLSVPVPLRIVGDRRVEGPETFFIRLREAVSGVIGRRVGTATIVNDDVR